MGNRRTSLQKEFVKYKFAVDQYTMNFGDSVPEMDLSEFSPSPPPKEDLSETASTAAGSTAGGSTAGGSTASRSSEPSTEEDSLIREVNHFRYRAVRDINEIARMPMDLSPFSTQQLFAWRKKMHMKSIAEYADLATV